MDHESNYCLLVIWARDEIVVIALVVLLLFGGTKIPELMKGLGKGYKIFKDEVDNIEKNIK